MWNDASIPRVGSTRRGGELALGRQFWGKLGVLFPSDACVAEYEEGKPKLTQRSTFDRLVLQLPSQARVRCVSPDHSPDSQGTRLCSRHPIHLKRPHFPGGLTREAVDDELMSKTHSEAALNSSLIRRAPAFLFIHSEDSSSPRVLWS